MSMTWLVPRCASEVRPDHRRSIARPRTLSLSSDFTLRPVPHYPDIRRTLGINKHGRCGREKLGHRLSGRSDAGYELQLSGHRSTHPICSPAGQGDPRRCHGGRLTDRCEQLPCETQTMVMPLSDESPTQIVPVVNYAIIALNVLVFFVQQSQPESFTIAYAATPYEITHNRDIARPVVVTHESAEQDALGRIQLRPEEQVIPQGPIPFPVWFTLLTSIFMHGGLAHLGGNMLYLWIFGDNVEEVLGHVRYALVYLTCGLVASLSHIALAPNSLIPTLGASGAIAGVMGMYIIWFPHNRVRAGLAHDHLDAGPDRHWPLDRDATGARDGGAVLRRPERRSRLRGTYRRCGGRNRLCVCLPVPGACAWESARPTSAGLRRGTAGRMNPTRNTDPVRKRAKDHQSVSVRLRRGASTAARGKPAGVVSPRGLPDPGEVHSSIALERITDGLRTLCQPMFCGLKGRGNPAQGETLGLVHPALPRVHPEGVPEVSCGAAVRRQTSSPLAAVGAIARGGRIRNAIVTRSNGSRSPPRGGTPRGSRRGSSATPGS